MELRETGDAQADVRPTGTDASLQRSPTAITAITPETLEKHPDVELKVEKGCCSASEFFMLNQTFALVRHGDRLDKTSEWQAYPGRKDYPNDTPLTREGFEHASTAGDYFKKQGAPFKLIVASPYYRCAQTASCIAQKLKIPIHFDLDMGEIFDDVSMLGNCANRPQHRPPAVLEAALKPDFPDVEYIRDESGQIKIEGKLQRFPESFFGARMRFCYKTQKLLQQATAELGSIVIVTHGDALASVLGMFKEDWIIKDIPYTSYMVGTRQVKVMGSGVGCKMLPDQAVFQNPDQWQLDLDPGIVHVNCKKQDLAKVHADHEKEMVKMEKKKGQIHTTYKLTPKAKGLARQESKAALEASAATTKEMKALLKKAGTTQHLSSGMRIEQDQPTAEEATVPQ